MTEGDFDEDVFETHRAIRQERKRISQSDRSKYKKTDWEKRAEARSALKEGELCGRVMRALGDLYFVQLPDRQELLPCNLRGVLKKEITASKNLVVVGDMVLVRPSSCDQGTIEAVLARSSALYRADNLSRRRRHLLAANVQWALIVSSIAQPPVKPALLDRCIIAAQKGGIQPILVINKIDLLRSEKTSSNALLQELQKIYASLSIPLICTSAEDETGLDELIKIIDGKGAAVAGQSGVGKTSLLNKLTGSALPVGPVRIKTGKGTHTTTHAQLVPLKGGGWIIDTPGVSSFGIWQLDLCELKDFFSEIHAAGQSCRFGSCSHRGETGCAIPQAIKSGQIAPLRFHSYLTLHDELSQPHLRR